VATKAEGKEASLLGDKIGGPENVEVILEEKVVLEVGESVPTQGGPGQTNASTIDTGKLGEGKHKAPSSQSASSVTLDSTFRAPLELTTDYIIDTTEIPFVEDSVGASVGDTVSASNDANRDTTAIVKVGTSVDATDDTTKPSIDVRPRRTTTLPLRAAPRLRSLIGMVEEEIANLRAQAALLGARSAYRSYR
jgi:hypothetical protein